MERKGCFVVISAQFEEELLDLCLLSLIWYRFGHCQQKKERTKERKVSRIYRDEPIYSP
jgi:hypothetical protein